MAAVAFAPAFLTALVMERQKTTVGQTWMATQGVMIFGMIPAIISFAISSGFFDRISNGLVDKSAMTRVWQYGMLQYLTPHQIMFGASTTTASDWSTRLFQTPSIENSFVLGVFTYGMPLTIFYLTMVILVVCIFAMRGSMIVKIASAVFLAAALSNNTFGAKNPAVFYMLMMSGASIVGSRRTLFAVRRNFSSAGRKIVPVSNRPLPGRDATSQNAS